MIQFRLENDFNKLIREEMLADGVNRNSVICNLGCEYRLIPEALRGIVDPKNAFGLELQDDIVAANDNIFKCDVDRQRFPFEDGSLDYVIAVWGLEHFQKENVFHESERVLKKGGKFIFLTCNVWNPLFFWNKYSRGLVGKVYYKYLTRNRDYGGHPTHYLFNSCGKIRETGEKAGLRLTKCIYLGPSNILDYFAFFKPLQAIVTGVEWCLTNPLLYRFKPYFICILEKP